MNRRRAIVAVLLLLTSACVLEPVCASVWEWDELDGADGYYLMWSFGDRWHDCMRIDLGPVVRFDDAALWELLPTQPGAVTYFQIAGYDDRGPGPLGPGRTLDECPVEICP